MATITITIPDQQVTRLRDAVQALRDRSLGADPDAKPLTKAEALAETEAMCVRYLNELVRAHEVTTAQENAAQAARTASPVIGE